MPLVVWLVLAPLCSAPLLCAALCFVPSAACVWTVMDCVMKRRRSSRVTKRQRQRRRRRCVSSLTACSSDRVCIALCTNQSALV